MGRPRLYSQEEAIIKQKASIKMWKQNHRERLNQYMKTWRKAHKGKVVAYNRFYYLKRKFLSLQMKEGSLNTLSKKEMVELEPLIISDCQNMTQVKVAVKYHISRRTVQRIVAKHNPKSKYYEPPKD